MSSTSGIFGRRYALGDSLKLLLVLASASGNTALAAENFHCGKKIAKWENTAITYLVDKRFSDKEESSIRQAAAAWNERGPGIRNVITLVPDSERDIPVRPLKDEINTVSKPSRYPQEAGKTAAATFVVGDPECRIRDIDIVFRDMPWTHLRNPSFGKQRNNMVLRAIHEFGHGFGLAHENKTLATMNEDYPHGGVVGRSWEIVPHADDLAGLRQLYGAATTGRDVVASAYYHPCDRRPKSGCASPKVFEIEPPAGNPVAGGPAFTMSYTVENRGTLSCANCQVDFYISPDPDIEPSISGSDDVHIGTTHVTIPGGMIKTGTVSVQIPQGIKANKQYYWGYIVDRFNKHASASADLTNNAVVLRESLAVADVEAKATRK